MLRFTSLLAAMCLSVPAPMLVAPTAARGQCPSDWLPGQGIPGVDGYANAVTVWDPDGLGPGPALLVVGGDFEVAGGAVASDIAAWDGSAWQPLGSGMDGDVFALAGYNGELIAGGYFTTAGGASANNIARWDGSVWQPLGSGMDAYVLALAVYNGELIAGGNFTTAGGVSATTTRCTPPPRACQAEPFQRAMKSALAPPAEEKSPPAISSPL